MRSKSSPGRFYYIKGKESEVNIRTGEGNDRISVTTEYSGLDAGSNFGNELKLDTGAGADNVTLAHNAGVLRADISTGAGGDTVNISGGLDGARKYTRNGAEWTSYLNVDLGAGSDNITVNVIENNHIVEKKRLKLPKMIKNVIKCKNPRCITSIEQGLDQIFILTDPENEVYRCKYCEEKQHGSRRI